MKNVIVCSLTALILAVAATLPPVFAADQNSDIKSVAKSDTRSDTSSSLNSNTEDHTIRPGIGLGIVKLGMNKDQVKKLAGNHDGSYTLPSGVVVEWSQWKETAPKKSPNLRFFYDIAGKLIQINSAAPVPATADGISCNSTPSAVSAKYKNLKCFEYRARDARIDYCDDVKQGIAFEYTRAESDKAKQLYAIITHLPGKRVIADVDERAVSTRLSP